MDDFSEIIKEFLIEAYEKLEILDRQVLVLEKHPQDTAIVREIFQLIHSIKGTCGFLGLCKLESVSHAGENLLDSIRAGRVGLEQEIFVALLQLVDACREILGCVERGGDEGTTDYSELSSQLLQFAKAGAVAKERAYEAVEKTSEAPVVELEKVTDLSDELPAGENSLGESEAAVVTPSEDTASVSVVVEESVSEASASQEETVQEMDPVPNEVKMSEEQAETKASPPAKPEKAQAAKPAGESQSASPKQKSISETALRVDVGLLDYLMNLVGELVLARNQVLQYTKGTSDAGLISTTQQLNLIVSELQEGVMRTRMQPIANVWNKFPRVVRDVARACEKKVRVEMEGKGTELDKTILEAIKDPLTHIVRNSVDHGIEKPEDREAAGKDPEGTLLLRAFHEGGHVIIEIADDGGGLNTDRIREKVLEKGLVPPDRLAAMSDQEIHRLIFMPGFSTAEVVSNISGRGVGMDVVRSNIEKIGGAVDLLSTPGQGTTIMIKIPLTLAIVPALVVSDAGQRFAIPQVSLVELLRVEGSNIDNQVEQIQGAHFYRLRGNLLPLVYLKEVLKTAPDELEPSELSTRIEARSEEQDAEYDERVMNIVVVKADEQQFGLVVDSVRDTEEIVVKPLGKQLKDIEAFAGATIMGDGRVALIIDVLGLARMSSVMNEEMESSRSAADRHAESLNNSRQTLLLVRIGEQYRVAIPLDDVNRLEEFEVEKIERAGGRELVQYRGGILPLVNLSSYFKEPVLDGEIKNVVVYHENGHSVGLVVDKIVDIVEEELVVQHQEDRLGVSGAAVIQGKITDLLNVHEVLQKEYPVFFRVPKTPEEVEAAI